MCSPVVQGKEYKQEGGQPISGRALVARMLHTLDEEREAGWVHSILKELCCGAGSLPQHSRQGAATTLPVTVSLLGAGW